MLNELFSEIVPFMLS